MERILIKNIDKLKVTKVKYWKVNFEYDGTKYVLVDTSDEDRHISLYVRRYNEEKGYYYSELINGRISLTTPGDMIKFIGKGEVYSQVDKEHFVKSLVRLEFSEGLFEEEYNKYIDAKAEIEEKIDMLRAEMSKLSADWNSTSGHGSKTTSLANSFKLKNAEKIKGAKDGEWCEEYDRTYGSIHGVYGGVLTDLYNLPVGTFFYCTNGCWYGSISFNEKGRKTVITDKVEVELTPDKHSLYISKIHFNKTSEE